MGGGKFINWFKSLFRKKRYQTVQEQDKEIQEETKKEIKKKSKPIKCTYCKKEIFTFINKFTCPYCKKIHCEKHRLPENHKCKRATKPKNLLGGRIIYSTGGNTRYSTK